MTGTLVRKSRLTERSSKRGKTFVELTKKAILHLCLTSFYKCKARVLGRPGAPLMFCRGG